MFHSCILKCLPLMQIFVRCVYCYTYDQMGCGGTMTGSYGVFTTEYYPDYYPPFTRTCTWHIEVGIGRSVSLTFKDFQVAQESNKKCVDDFVLLVDGIGGPNIGTFCGTEIPPVQRSTGNVMMVHFKTTSDTNISRGFYAEWAASDVTVLNTTTYAIQPGNSSVPFSVTCRPDVGKSVTSISLLRSKALGTNKTYHLIAQAKSGLNNGNVQAFLETTESSYSGNIASYVTVTFNKGTCKDSGFYKCVYIYSVNSAEQQAETVHPIYVTYMSVRNSFTVDPQSTRCHSLGTEVEITCILAVGALYMGQQKIVRWESRLSGSASWSPENILPYVPSWPEYNSGNECLIYSPSRLRKTVREDYDRREYRCSVAEDGMYGDSFSSVLQPTSSFFPLGRAPDLDLTLTAFPKSTSYSLDSELELTCKISFGISGLAIKANWYWAYRSLGSEQHWTPFTPVIKMQFNDNISCQYVQLSKILIKLTLYDTNRVYRCHYSKRYSNGTEENSTKMAAYFRIEELQFPALNSQELATIILLCLGIGWLLIDAGVYIYYFCSARPKQKRTEVQEPKFISLNFDKRKESWKKTSTSSKRFNRRQSKKSTKSTNVDDGKEESQSSGSV